MNAAKVSHDCCLLYRRGPSHLALQRRSRNVPCHPNPHTGKQHTDDEWTVTDCESTSIFCDSVGQSWSSTAREDSYDYPQIAPVFLLVSRFRSILWPTQFSTSQHLTTFFVFLYHHFNHQISSESLSFSTPPRCWTTHKITPRVFSNVCITQVCSSGYSHNQISSLQATAMQ